MAREMLLAAQVLDAPMAAQRGFQNRVLPDDQVAAEAAAMAARVSQLAPGAARMNKQCLRALALDGRAQAATYLIANAYAYAYAYADTAEHREGVTAFVEKRTPQF